MTMTEMDYYAPRLQCTDAEKDACLETVAKIARLRAAVLRDGWLIVEILGEKEPDPFLAVCMQEFGRVYEPEELETLLTQYLMAEDYRGQAFRNAVVARDGIVALCRHCKGMSDGDEVHCAKGPIGWGEFLGASLRGWFGLAYREKVDEVIRREVEA